LDETNRRIGIVRGVLPVSLPRLRAPAENRAVLAHPPLAEIGSRVEFNRSLFSNSDLQLDGARLAGMRRSAVAEIIAAARTYLIDAGEPAPDLSADSLFVAGHQPDLFHPGVWVKNYALNALAGRHGAMPLNLIVDNDTAKASAIHVPVWGRQDDPAAVHLVTLPYDHFPGEVPYEERTVHDERLFAEFPETVKERTSGWPFDPILPDHWADVLRQRERTPLLGERFAAARRVWERRWGCQNLELPISRLCATESFARFAVALVEQLPAFHTTYNDCVHDYRSRHGIRSPNHPVPDLLRDGDWLEAPFWAWRAGGQRRSRLFVRSVASGWRLRVGGEPWPDLPRAGAAERWRRLETEGFKIRTRALTTTLFARLCLADLFIHGIGGGKYDELTDLIIAKQFGIRPPAFLILTGTLRLPLPGYPARADDERAAWRSVRDIHWNPQRHLPADAEDWQDMVEARQRVTVQTDKTWRKERFKELRRLTDRIRTRIAAIEAEARRAAERASAEAAANAILRRRDYAFCLYPESSLRPFLTQFQANVISTRQPPC
jgi:hypothetical protein